ncbi:RNA-guided endonuclease InsQ/TnpB family protein [Candidatus Cryosericum hinesii]|jgi:putative transposase|nr:RNA-guided endonuclease TnpB family protein [Candidatus Cryosericum hinesii]
MRKAYKFRLYPNTEQQAMFAKAFGCARFVYNQMLADKIVQYKTDKTVLHNTPAQYKGRFKWLREVDAFALCNAQLQLQTAYTNFFRHKSVGFPNFRSRKSHRDSYTTNLIHDNICIENGHLKLPKTGLVCIKLHRQIPVDHKIKSVTISCTSSGRYYAAILTEYEFTPPVVALDESKALGLDYSSPHFYVDSQDTEADMPHFYREAESILNREQRRLSRMVRGSNNYARQKRRIAVMLERVSDCRKDWLHKQSTELANKWDYVCVEDINLRGMAGSLKLGKSTNDNGFGMFRLFLDYKLAERGKRLVTINKWFPSSKTCHVCGAVNHALTLKDREWDCACGAHLLRDLNAAINIKNAGLSLVNTNRGVHGDSSLILSRSCS